MKMKPINELKDVFITDSEFEVTYKPMLNHLDDNSSLGGYMFETHNEEYAYVCSVYQENEYRVWTYMDGNNDLPIYVSGLWKTNAIGYLITELPFSDDVYITVLDDFENPVRYCYTDAICPDCEEMIPFDVVDGDECSNCGHVFTIIKECDN
jgi:hypothetical protein